MFFENVVWWVWAVLGLQAVGLLLVLWLLLRRPRASEDELAHRQALSAALAQQTRRIERSEGELRREIGDNARSGRQEIQQTLATFQEALIRQGAETTRTQNAQIDAFAQQLVQLRTALSDTLVRQLQDMSESNARRLSEVRTTLDGQLNQLQQSNAAKLDEMRATVDEKLQSTLQARLGESFKQVADRLEQVHKGLGEMQTLAQGVGDLKHLLTNVKTRGMFGEAQLAALLEQVFAPDQYATQVATRPGSRNVVDFAIRMPGRSLDGEPCWLPIDAKFPNEDYERLLDAQQRADAEGAEAAARGLEQRIRLEAKSMAEKYLEPPHTTDFAILFFAHRRAVRRGVAPPGLDGGLAARTPRDPGRTDHADGHAQFAADGLSHAGAGKAQQRGMAGAGSGQNRVWQVWRCAGQGQEPDANRAQHAGQRPNPQPRHEPRFENRRSLAARPGQPGAAAGLGRRF